MTTRTYRERVTRPHGYGITSHIAKDGSPWFDGCVLTSRGYVRVTLSQQGHTRLSIVHEGYLLDRFIKRTYTARGLVTLADRFAREVCA